MALSRLIRSMPFQAGLLSSLALMSFTVFAQVDRTRGGPVGKGEFSGRYILQSASPDNLQWVQDPAGSKRIVLQARLRASDEMVFGGRRTEIIPQREMVGDGVRWYGFSVYFPEDWQPHPYPTLVAQLHTSQDKVITSPPLALVVQGNNLDLELYANHRPLGGEEPITRSNSARQLIRLDKLRLGRWYCFVIRADWSHTPGSGALKLWMNGDRVYESANLYNSYDTTKGNYPKAGLYMPGMASVNERKIYLDFIHVGGPRMGYEEMAAQMPCNNTATGGANQ